MTTFINLTPHAIVLNGGATIPPSGTVARVSCSYTSFDNLGVASAVFGEVQNLPAPTPGEIYIVSALVAQAAKRADVVSPATGHPECVRNEHGHIVSVPGFIRG